MASKMDMLRAAEGMKIKTSSTVVEESKTNAVKKTTKQINIEIDLDDLAKLEELVVKFSTRDNVLYKKKDVNIAMVKYFLESVERNIDKIKIERY
jgi:hypothetical protein